MSYVNPDIESSYRENDIGRTLYQAVLEHKPRKIIEFGTLYGYSTVAMAQALRELGGGKIVAYDLFDQYPFKHSQKDTTQANIDKYGLGEYVELQQMNIDDWIKHPEEVDMMHIDISNNGDTLEKLYTALKPQIESGMILFFEGGSVERDNIEWMKKYGFKKINNSSVPFKVVNEKFPSLSVMQKM